MIRQSATMIRGRLVPDNLPSFMAGLKLAYPNGTKLWITLSKVQGVSDPLRRYYFGAVLETIQNHTGHSKDGLHDFFKRHFLGTVLDDYGIETVPHVFSRESDLSHEERVQFVDDVRMFAADNLELFIPDPDPQWRKQR